MKQQWSIQQKSDSPLVVGVGASAGGLDAFQELLSELGDAPGLTIVFVQHLDPDSKTLLVDLLSHVTSMAVVEITAREKLKKDTVYVCPPRMQLELKNGFVCIAKSEESDQQSSAIDHLFHSIAEDQGERGVGVILSGAGSDGTLGLKAISDCGGLTFAQDAKSATFDSMPRSAATTGVADHVLPPGEIAAELLSYVKHLNELSQTPSAKRVSEEINEAIPLITETLVKTTNHNFQHYKPNTLTRRIQRRMQLLKITSASDYLDYLTHHEEESQALFRELLIGVTSFFRDPEAFASLKSKVLPKLFEQRTPDDAVRIWVAGCANGAEAYTLAILCREVMDDLATEHEVQIFATDIDERALQIARAGSYPIGIEEHVSPERLKRFFVKRGKQYQIKKEIRELVLFSAHNLISDPPFSRQDLISCRNLLIYLGPHLQNKLIPLFHYALRPSGYLFLGPSENVTSHAELFRSVDAKQRISQRKGTVAKTMPSLSLRQSRLAPLEPVQSTSEHPVDLTAMAQRIVLDEFAPKHAIINESGQILNSSADLEKYVQFQGGDYHNNLIKLVHSGLRIGLRSALHEAIKTSRKVQHDNLSIRDGEKIQRMMLTVQPMPRLGEDEPLFLVVFHEVGLPIERDELNQPLTQAHNHADSLIVQLEQELETTRRDLEKSMQDMEAANEELKSSNEELLSMNEELQSANEELETSKDEIRASSDAVERANTDLQNLLRSTQIATVFLDENLCIRSFTPAIADLYPLIPTDVGRPLERFVPLVTEMPPLPDPQSIHKGESVEHTVVADSGKSYIRRVLPYQSNSGQTQGIVVTFTDVTQLSESQELFQLLVDASAQIVWITSADGFVVEDSPSWRAFTGQSFDEGIGQGWLDVIHPEDRGPTMTKWKAMLDSGEPVSMEYRLKHHSGEYRWTQVRAVPQLAIDGSIKRWVGMNSDIDDQKRAEQELLESREQLRLGVEIARLGLGRIDYKEDTVSLSSEAAKIYGFGESETTVSRKQIHALFHPDDRDSVESEIARCLDPQGDGICEVDHRIVLQGGVQRWISVGKKVYFDRTVDPPVPLFATLVTKDITYRKQWELNLTERESHLRRVINNQLGLVGMIDRNGNLVEVDNRSLEIAKTSREEVIGKHFADAPWWSYDPKVSGQMRDAMRRAFNGEVVRFDVSLFAHGDEGVMIDFMIAPVKNDQGVVEYLIPSGVDIRDRYRAEQRLIENERRVSMALKAGDMAAWEWTEQKSYWEPKLFELLGIPPVEAPSSELFFSFVHPDDRPDLQAAWRLATLGKEEYESQFRVIRPDGQVRWLAAVGMTSCNEEGRVVAMHGLNWDITDEKEYQRRIEASEERLRLALKAAELSLWQWNVDDDQWFWSDDQNGDEILFPSKPMANLAGFLARIHKSDRAEVAAAIRQTLKNGRPYRTEYRVRKDGGFRWVLALSNLSQEDAHSPQQMVGVEVDITERKESELELRLNEERLRLAGEAAGFGSFRVDVKNGLVDWSPEVRRIIGYEDRDVPGNQIGEVPTFIHPDDQNIYADAIRQAFTDQDNPRGSLDHRIVRPDGEVRDIRTNWMSMWTKNEEGPMVEQVIATMLDITKQREYEQMLKVARRQAEAANESKSAFVANMSHEIRTPMTAILGYTELIRDRIQDAEALEHLRTIRRNGDYLLEIINDILDLSKIEAGKLEISSEYFNPARLVEDVRSIMEVRATENNLKLEVDYETKIPVRIQSDSKRLKQILINLVGNAIKFTKTGNVTVSIRHINESELQFEIQDTGIGMTDEQQKKLFKPFSQGDASVSRHFGGTGLGLAITRRLADMLGGTISVTSELHQGSTFTVRVPTGDTHNVELVQPDMMKEITQEGANHESAVTVQLNCRILVVDDRTDVRFLSKHILTRAGATVDEAEDGQVAVDHITSCIDRESAPDLILLDMQMPNLDGYETAKQLRSIGYTKPIIALTADAMQGDVNRCVECGCNDYLSKPIDTQQLIHMVRRFTQ